MLTAQRIFYGGHVQGVGFRRRVAAIARDYPVRGYVQNLADGRVLLHAEGDHPAVRDFLAAVGERLQGHIASRTTEEVTPESHVHFTIRYE